MTGPKSDAGQRTVSLPKVVVEALEKQHATEQRDREIAAYLDDVIPEP